MSQVPYLLPPSSPPVPQSESLLTNDGSHTLHNTRYGQTYHSTFGALTEARHVFLDAAGVNARLQQGLPTRILEIGFGLGLNTLLSLDLASQHKTHIEYHAYEHALVPAATIEALNYSTLITTPNLHDAMVQAVDQAHQLDASAQAHRAVLNAYATLTLHFGDATTQPLSDIHSNTFHAIYLDAFSPDTNAECWSPEFMSNLGSVLAADGKLSTYSAKGDVRRAMLASQLTVEKRPGPPGKREFLVAFHAPTLALY